jgi:transcriptional regulator with XRE-family HTH domain
MATYGEQIQAAVAAQIRAELGVAKMSQAELARAIGVHPATISRYLDIENPRDIRWDDFAEIAKALGLTPRELVERAERRMEDEGGSR